MLDLRPKNLFDYMQLPQRQEVAVNRSELVDEIAHVAGIEKRHAEAAMSAFVDSVVSTAKAGERLSIFAFGTFTPSNRPARMGRNPRTGAPVKVAARKVVKFTPAAAFKDAINSRGGKKAAAKKAPAKKAKKKSTAKRAPAKKKKSAARKSTRRA